jgi:ribonuclease HII
MSMIIAGVDEVGRGCWAGPVVAAAVALAEPIPGLKDSKKLSKKARERLALQIKKEALAIGIGWVDAMTVDEVGINQAVKEAMTQAIAHIQINYDEIIIDGHINFLAENPMARPVIKADDTVPAVSAASIIAKVERDNYMDQQATEYPLYGFELHVGYGTAYHIKQLREHGVSPLHRKSYKPIKNLLVGSGAELNIQA